MTGDTPDLEQGSCIYVIKHMNPQTCSSCHVPLENHHHESSVTLAIDLTRHHEVNGENNDTICV